MELIDKQVVKFYSFAAVGGKSFFVILANDFCTPKLLSPNTIDSIILHQASASNSNGPVAPFVFIDAF